MSPLEQIIKLVNEYVGGLIDVADMPDADKTALKAHLLAAEEILIANGQRELKEVLSSLTGAVLGRLG